MHEVGMFIKECSRGKGIGREKGYSNWEFWAGKLVFRLGPHIREFLNSMLGNLCTIGGYISNVRDFTFIFVTSTCRNSINLIFKFSVIGETFVDGYEVAEHAYKYCLFPPRH